MGPGMVYLGGTATGGVNTSVNSVLGVGRKDVRDINLKKVAGPDCGTDR